MEQTQRKRKDTSNHFKSAWDLPINHGMLDQQFLSFSREVLEAVLTAKRFSDGRFPFH